MMKKQKELNEDLKVNERNQAASPRHACGRTHTLSLTYRDKQRFSGAKVNARPRGQLGVSSQQTQENILEGDQPLPEKNAAIQR